jgi:hypothetical protein
MRIKCRPAQMFYGFIFVLSLVALGTTVSRANEEYFVSFGLNGTIGGQELLPNNLYGYDPVSDVATLLLDGDAAGLNTTINGIDVLPSGNTVLSFGLNGTIGDQELLTTNLYEYDPVNDVTTLFLDGSAAGLNSTINGVDVLPSGNLLLSFGMNGSIGGQEVLTNNIYEYDPVSGVATLFFDGGAVELTSSINGIDVLPSGNFLLTFGLIGTIGGQGLLPNNIYEYNPVNDVATLFLDGNAAGLDNVVSGIASLTVIPEPSSLLLFLIAASAFVFSARGRCLRAQG